MRKKKMRKKKMRKKKKDKYPIIKTEKTSKYFLESKDILRQIWLKGEFNIPSTVPDFPYTWHITECFDDIKEFKCMIYPNIRGGYGVQAISDFIDDKLVNRCSCDLPAVTNTDTQELIDGVRVEFVHRNKFLAVVHGELEDVKVFAKNHFK